MVTESSDAERRLRWWDLAEAFANGTIGCREIEATHLARQAARCAKVGLATKTVLVKEGLVEGKQTDRTKTGVAREVDLNALAILALERQAKWSRLQGTIVFTHPLTGKGWEREQQVYDIWAPALKRLGVRYRRPYNMRHTYATTSIMAGLKPAYIADQLGHSVQVLFEPYAKWLRGKDNQREQAVLHEYIGTVIDKEKAK